MHQSQQCIISWPGSSYNQHNLSFILSQLCAYLNYIIVRIFIQSYKNIKTILEAMNKQSQHSYDSKGHQGQNYLKNINSKENNHKYKFQERKGNPIDHFDMFNINYTKSRPNFKNLTSLSQVFRDYLSNSASGNTFILQLRSDSIGLKIVSKGEQYENYQPFPNHMNLKNIRNKGNINRFKSDKTRKNLNERAVPLVSISTLLDRQILGNKNLSSKSKNVFNERRTHQLGHLRQFNTSHQKQNRFMNAPQILNFKNQQGLEDQDQQLFVFKVKDHNSSRKNSLLNALQTYERRSTSRSHSNSRTKNTSTQSPKNSQRAFKSQIRMSPLNPKTIFQNFKTNRTTNFKSQTSEPSFQNQPLYSNNIFQDNLNKANNFSFDQEKRYLGNNRSQLPSQRPQIVQKKNHNQQMTSGPLHTIEEVQQSIRSIQIPQNQLFDDELSKKINQHFEQIKQNMLKQLIMKSINGKGSIDQVSMENIVGQLQMAADSIVKKYQTSFQHRNYNMKNSQKKQKKNLSQNSGNQPNKPVSPDICGSDENYIEQVSVHQNQKVLNNMSSLSKPNIMDLQKIFDNFDNFSIDNSKNVQFNKSKQFNQFMKKGLITNQQLNLYPYRQDYEQGHGIQLKIVGDSFAETQTRQNRTQIRDHFQDRNQRNIQLAILNQPLKYEQCSKNQSSISSIKSNLQERNQGQGINLEAHKNMVQNNTNKDSMKAEVQSLNRYTFLKHYKDRPQNVDAATNSNVVKSSMEKHSKCVYKYQEKQLDQSQYKIIEDHRENSQVYTVRYNLKILNQNVKEQKKKSIVDNASLTQQFQQRKSQVQVFRLSPLKFRRKEQVVQQMVKAKIIDKQSESFFR